MNATRLFASLNSRLAFSDRESRQSDESRAIDRHRFVAFATATSLRDDDPRRGTENVDKGRTRTKKAQKAETPDELLCISNK